MSPSKFLRDLGKLAREQERLARQRAREQEKLARQQEMQVRQLIHEEEKQVKEQEKQAKEQHHIDQQKKADDENARLKDHLSNLEHVLDVALDRKIDVAAVVMGLVKLPVIPSPLPVPKAPDKKEFESRLSDPTLGERIFGIGRKSRQALIEEIRQQYHDEYELFKKEKELYIANTQERKRIMEERGTITAQFQARLESKDQDTVQRFFRTMLEQSPYPDRVGIPRVKLAYNVDTSELVVEYDLPKYDAIMPTVKEYRYVKARDVIEEKPLTKTDEKHMKDIYEGVVAGIALRVLHELFSADYANFLQLVVFNGMVNTVDKSTGRDIRPCLISVQVTKEDFQALDLHRVDKQACLKRLKAQTSPSSSEMVPVKPIVELVMTDPRFVAEVDVISGLDTRPNLLEMSPQDFEHLIANLFTGMGFKTNTTRLSRDGGVDVVAFHEDPILGGKVIIQAKRYKNTVGVESVRALYGVMQDEGATKGILVCTSSFGTASREFVQGKPITLIDGNGLLYYLEQNGYQAKIEVPES